VGKLATSEWFLADEKIKREAGNGEEGYVVKLRFLPYYQLYNFCNPYIANPLIFAIQLLHSFRYRCKISF